MEAEGADNIYSEEQLVSFALSGLSSTKNLKYETAIQLYNLECDNGKHFTLENIGKKFFSIDEKIAREQALTRSALGSVASSQYDHDPKRGNGRGYGARRFGSGCGYTRDQRSFNNTKKPQQAHLASHSNPTTRSITCYNCSEQGHIAPNCPKPKQTRNNPPRPPTMARGNAAHGSSNSNGSDKNNNPAIVCAARAFKVEQAFSARRVIEFNMDGRSRRPVPPIIPILEVSHDGSELLNFFRYVSLTFRVDESIFNPTLEGRISSGIIPIEYTGNFNPTDDNFWMMVHDHPLGDQDRTFAAILYPEQDAERIMSDGIIPLLENRFELSPNTLPGCFQLWANMIKAYAYRRLLSQMDVNHLPVSITSRNMTISITFYPVEHERPALVRHGNDTYIIPARNLPGNLIEDDDMSLDQAFAVKPIPSDLSLAIRRADPPISEIGDPCNLNNYLPDSGATQHMTPRSADLINVVEGQNLGVEVADGHIIKCSTTGDVPIKMQDDDGEEFTATLKDIMYVPGLSRRLFSITKFARHGHMAVIKDNGITLYFEPNSTAVTLSALAGGNNLAADIRVHQQNAISGEFHATPSARQRDHTNNKKRLSLELLHNRLGHRKCRTLLAAGEHNLWADVTVRMSPESGCLSCGISTIRATARNKEQHTGASAPGEYVFMDILHPITATGLTPNTSYAFYLILVDTFSRYTCMYGLPDKSTDAVVTAIKQYIADHKRADSYGYLDLARIRADAGSQFTSTEFSTYCRDAGIQLTLAAPKKQYQNHLVECTWQTISSMGRSLLVHARLPDIFMYHALTYACHIFNVLPVRGLLNGEETPATPHQLYLNKRPMTSHYRVFGCPVIVRRWVTHNKSNGKQTERSTRGIFIGFHTNQKGYVIYSPGSRQIIISDDIIFDENFTSAIATTWQQHKDSLALQPILSYIPDISTTLEHTGTIADIQPTSIEEGNTAVNDKVEGEEEDDTPSLCDAVDDDFDEFDDDDADLAAPPSTSDTPIEDETPMVLDSSNTLRRSSRTRKPNPKYANIASIVEWANTCTDLDLLEACAAEAHQHFTPSSNDAHSWEPAPRTIRDILKMPDGVVKKKLKTLVDAHTFIIDSMLDGEISIPVMEIFKVKILSYGSLDKLKCRLVVRGDLMIKLNMEDKWSPTASFRALKMFLAHAARLKVRVKQLDFVGAFLQAKMCSRIFVTIPQIFGVLFPEYSEYCGKPVRLGMSMYGTTLSGKYWYLELQEYLLEIGFKASENMQCLFIQHNNDGSKIYLLYYMDNMLYYGTDCAGIKQFEELLKQRFSVELMGQAHWYLATRINQLSNFDIELDQSRYCRSIVKKYLDAAGSRKINNHHSTPLPLDFVPTSENCSIDEDASKLLEREYNLDYASCIGSLIYLAMTRCDITFAVNKLAKYSKKPGKIHFEAMLHILRYLRDNSLVGIKFYSDMKDSPITRMLVTENIQQSHPFFTFSDSSWNDDVDTGRSTGCFIVMYMGGIIDHSSNLPDPVALSSAEAEYNEGCLAFMATSQLRMLLCEMEGVSESTMEATNVYFDSKSAIAMGNSYRDTKHTRHIMRRYHYIREGIASNKFASKWISTTAQIADIGTKQTPEPRHTFLMDLIHIKVKDQQRQIQEG
jgi:transposase InsO family protein